MKALVVPDNTSFVVVGAGNVGSVLIRELMHQNMDLIGAIVTKSGAITLPTHREIDVLLGDDQKKKNKLLMPGHHMSIADTCQTLEECDLIPIVIDVSINPDISMHPTLLADGFQVITANKVPASLLPSPEAIEMMQNPAYGYETTVMAGQGAIHRLKTENRTVLKIEGIFSGTLAYITKELERGVPLSEAIEAAINLGYTETNPMDDLDGMDVAKKLVILARTLGYGVELSDVEVEGLLGQSYRGTWEEGKDAFISEIKAKENVRIAQLLQENQGKVPRYVGSISYNGGKVHLKVSIQFVELQSELAVADSNKMIITVNSESDGIDKVSIGGKGAGPITTSSGVLRDVQAIINRNGKNN